MRVYAAGTASLQRSEQEEASNFLYVLESFFYFKNWQKQFLKSSFMLDSGAFTFMNSGREVAEISGYVNRYINFINENDVKLFYELDIDVIVGLAEVEKIREKLECETGKKCIPVWHKQRGLQYWKDITHDYNYVAIGGIVVKNIKQTEWEIFNPLIQIAHKNKCQVHGLGMGNMEAIRKYPFDSVDSTGWAEHRFNKLRIFENGILKMWKKKGVVKRHEAIIHNINEMIKFQEYAEKYY